MSYDPSAASFGYSAAPNTGYPAQPAMIGGVAGAVPAQDGFYTYEWNPTPAPTFGAPAGPVYEETTVVQSAPTFYGAAPVAPAPAVYETGYYETGCCAGGCQSCGNGCQGCIGGCGCGNGCGNGCGGGCCDGGCLGGCGGCYGGCGQCYGGCCAPAIPGPCHFIISIIFSFFALVAFVFFIVGCATSQWTKDYRVRGGPAVTSAAGQTVNLGLWRFCAGGSESDCTNIDNLNNPNDVPQDGDLWDRLNTVRAFSIIALVTTFFAWIISIVFIFRYNWGLKWSIITLATIGWISGLIAMAVWVSIHKDLSSGDYGYSFGLTTAAWPVLLIVTILLWFVDWGIPIRPVVAAPVTYAAPATFAPAPVSYAPAPMQYSYPAAPVSAAPMAAPTVAVATNYASY